MKRQILNYLIDYREMLQNRPPELTSLIQKLQYEFANEPASSIPVKEDLFGNWQISTVATQSKTNNQWSIGIFCGNDHELGIQVACAKGETKEDVSANASLIVMAPDMYRTIKSFLQKINDFPCDGMSTEEISILSAIEVIAEYMFSPLLKKVNPNK